MVHVCSCFNILLKPIIERLKTDRKGGLNGPTGRGLPILRGAGGGREDR